MKLYTIWAYKGFKARFNLDLSETAIDLLEADHWDWRINPNHGPKGYYLELQVRTISLGWQTTSIRGLTREDIFRHVVANAIQVGQVSEQ